MVHNKQKLRQRETAHDPTSVGITTYLNPRRHFADWKSAVEMFIISLLQELFYYKMIPLWIENISGIVCESLRVGCWYEGL